MRNNAKKSYIILLVVLSFIIVGCSKSGNISDTYLNFSVEGEEYQLNYIVFDILKLNNHNLRFMGLGQDPLKVNIVTSIPGAAMQWRMVLSDTADLQGSEIDISDLKDDKLSVTIQFSLTQDISVSPDNGSETKLHITSISDNYIEGSFEGENWVYVSMTSDTLKKVNISGDFRAKLNINDNLSQTSGH